MKCQEHSLKQNILSNFSIICKNCRSMNFHMGGKGYIGFNFNWEGSVSEYYDKLA